MVDVVFLLLIFFLSATTFGRFEGKIEANLPRVHLEKPKAKPRQMIVTVRKKGLLVNGKPMTRKAFLSKLREIVQYDPDQYVFIDGEPDVLQGDVIDMFDQCSLAGANVTIVPPGRKERSGEGGLDTPW
jgi:biopolymer transport protein ExbD